MLDKARQISAALTRFVPPLLIVSVLILSLFLLVSGYLVNPAAFNSDNLLTSAQCDDLLHGQEVTESHFPGAPYIFPDLLLYLPCQGLSPTEPIAFLSYCLLIHFILAGCLSWLGRLSGLSWRSAIIAAGCGLILLIAMYLKKALIPLASLLIHPGSHLAALVVGLFLLALTIHCLRRGLSWKAAALYLLVGGFGSFSDRLVIVQLQAPLVLALILVAARGVISRKQVAVQLALIAGSVLLSWVIRVAFQRVGFHLLELETLPFRPYISDFVSMLSQLYQEIANDRLLSVLIPLHLLAALAIVWFRSRRSVETAEMEGDRSAVLLIALTLLLSPPCILGALFVLGMAHHPAIGRYTLSCWFLPPLLLPLLMCWLPGRASRVAAIALQFAILSFALQRAAVLLPGIDGTRYQQPYPPLAQALDRLARERGPINGLGSFWLARSTTYFTREKITILPLTPGGEPYFHASNPARIVPDDNLRLPQYRFVVVRPGDPGLTAAVAAVLFGTPSEKIAAGTDEIWLYESLRLPALDRFLRARLAGRLQRRLPYTGPVEPACLGHPKVNLTRLNASGIVALKPGQTCEVRFGKNVMGRLLDVGANADARLDIEFFRGEEPLGSLAVPSVPWTGASYGHAGIQSRLIPLPAAVREQPWDRLIVRPRSDGENVHLGHILVFAQHLPGLDEPEPPLPYQPRIHLEAEDTLPNNIGMAYRDDATACGGRIRCSEGYSLICVLYTPRLFLPPGRYRLEASMKVDAKAGPDEDVAGLIGWLTPTKQFAHRKVLGKDFATAGRWITQQMIFEVPKDAETVLLGIVGLGKTPLSVDYLDVIAEPPESPDEEK